MLTFIVYADGYVVACMDVLQITHAAISMVNFMFQNSDIYKGSYFVIVLKMGMWRDLIILL